MMERLPVEIGRVVCSRQGRDANRCFVILQVLDDQFVLMADGLTRKLDHPKKKKIKHLWLKPVRMDHLEELKARNCLQDASIRRFLNENGFGIDQPLCKED